MIYAFNLGCIEGKKCFLNHPITKSLNRLISPPRGSRATTYQGGIDDHLLLVILSRRRSLAARPTLHKDPPRTLRVTGAKK